MGLIVLPKMLAVRREQRGFDKHTTPRGSRAHVTVTGIQNQAGSLETPTEAHMERSSNDVLSPEMRLGTPRIQTVTME